LLIGYARVSTEDQHLDLQHDALRKIGCEKTFDDKKSGVKTDRPGLTAALDYARAGDQLVVWRLDRLGRSLPDLISLVRRLDDKGVQLRSVTEGIDTSTINGKLTFHLGV
jgi:DNA invertase Pin-like site-specific DNA recombinase